MLCIEISITLQGINYVPREFCTQVFHRTKHPACLSDAYGLILILQYKFNFLRKREFSSYVK